jgi:hypothetical protein
MTPQQRKAKLYRVLNETYRDKGLGTGEEIRENLNSWAAEKSMDQFLGEKLKEIRKERRQEMRKAQWDPHISPTAIVIGLAIAAALFFLAVHP